MAVWAETEDVPASPLEAGVKAKGEYRCSGCGYGVTIYRELPLCPMCGKGLWEHLDWSPFRNVSAPLHLQD